MCEPAKMGVSFIGAFMFVTGEDATRVGNSVFSLQKHIKEHHEEVRERPCPHPGCNKVFMIDRYLQRHVKLIHTGVFQPATGVTATQRVAARACARLCAGVEPPASPVTSHHGAM